MGEALRARGDVTAAIRIGHEALEASDLVQNAALRAECLASLGVFFYDIGSNDQAESYLLEALTLLEHEDQVMSATACAAHYLLSYTLYARGAYTAGVEHAHEALTLARKFNLSREEGECLVSVAYYHVDLGEYEAAIRVYESALKCQRAAKDLRGEAVSLLNIGLCHIERGAFDAARAPLEQALQFGERMRVPRTQAVGLTYLGLMQEGCAEWSQAAASYAAACQLRLTIGQEPLAIDALAGIVRVAVATGDFVTARQRVGDILNWLATNGTDGIEYPIRVYVTLVHALRALGEIDRANVTLAEGLNVLAARAAQFSDPDLRRSFLEQVPFNHALMTLSGANAESPAKNGRSVSPDGTSED
jgi:tetratricopeptide (TPR) repeat protein